MSKNSNSHSGYRYKKWQQQVFQNGGNKCCLCGSIENLTADHIKPVVNHPELKYLVSNGRILCESCRVKDMFESWQNGIFKSNGKVKSKIKFVGWVEPDKVTK